MSSLYLDRKNLGLKLDGQTLALYEEAVMKSTVPLHLLERASILKRDTFTDNIPLRDVICPAISW